MEGLENLELDKDFQKSLMDVGDMVRRVLDANKVKNRIVTIMVCPSGRTVSAWDLNTELYDFYYENVPSYHGWKDKTQYQNGLQKSTPAIRLDTDPMEDDGK